MTHAVVIGASLLDRDINRGWRSQTSSSAILTSIIGAGKPPVKLQKSLFSGIKKHSRAAGKGVRAPVVEWRWRYRGIESCTLSRTRIERASSETTPDFEDVKANREQDECFN